MTPAEREAARAALAAVESEGLERSGAALRLSMGLLDRLWNGDSIERRVGVVLCVFPLNKANTTGNYVSNCERPGVGAVLRDVARRIDGARPMVDGDLFSASPPEGGHGEPRRPPRRPFPLRVFSGAGIRGVFSSRGDRR